MCGVEHMGLWIGDDPIPLHGANGPQMADHSPRWKGFTQQGEYYK